jgi:hypothetical protein
MNTGLFGKLPNNPFFFQRRNFGLEPFVRNLGQYYAKSTKYWQKGMTPACYNSLRIGIGILI